MDASTETADLYRPVSKLAIVAALAGGASLVVLVADDVAIWSVPAIAVATAIVALRQLAKATPPPIGRRLAWCGLVTGIAMLVAAPINRFARLEWAEPEAAETATEWIEHVRKGRRRAAHQLSLAWAARCPDGQTLSHCYRNDARRQEELEAYTQRRDVRQMLLWGEQARYGAPSALHRSFRGLIDEIGLVYPISLTDDDPHTRERSLRILLRRQWDAPSGVFYWTVIAVKLVDSADPQAH